MKDKKIINSTCVCKHRLNALNLEIIMIEPCEHLIHIDCFKQSNICPYCNVKILGITKQNDYKFNKKLNQKCIDILSVSTVDNFAKQNNFNLLCNMPHILSLIYKNYNINSSKDIKILCEEIFKLSGLTLKIKGMNKIKNTDKKVFISNHLGYFDSLILYYILECGFLVSSSLKNNALFKKIIAFLPIIFIQRGKKQNTVAKMKKIVNKYGSICLFPEAMFSHPGTLCRFRSGAFKIGEPVYPIVLQYSKCIMDSDLNKFVFKVASATNEIIEVKFLDPIYPPFYEDTPELVRHMMAKNGLLLSRVSGNDYND